MKLEGQIIQKIEFDNMYVVMVDENPIPDKEISNIFGVDINGKILWQIESPLYKFGVKNLIPYTLITKISNSEFIATNFYGVRYKFSASDGCILAKEEVSK